jgi:hypothetical protein
VLRRVFYSYRCKPHLSACCVPPFCYVRSSGRALRKTPRPGASWCGVWVTGLRCGCESSRVPVHSLPCQRPHTVVLGYWAAPSQRFSARCCPFNTARRGRVGQETGRPAVGPTNARGSRAGRRLWRKTALPDAWRRTGIRRPQRAAQRQLDQRSASRPECDASSGTASDIETPPALRTGAWWPSECSLRPAGHAPAGHAPHLQCRSAWRGDARANNGKSKTR